jgi:hypothetical protein
VFGVSCAYDVQDSMEKRVRSRFSNRKIFLPGLGSAKVRALPVTSDSATSLTSMLNAPALAMYYPTDALLFCSCPVQGAASDFRPYGSE